MKLQRLLPQESLPSRSGTDPVNFQSFTQVGEAVRRLGQSVTNAGIEIEQQNYGIERQRQALAAKEQESVDELDIQSGVSNFKARATQIIMRRENEHRQSLLEGGKLPHTYFQETLAEIDEAMDEVRSREDLSPRVRNVLAKELLKHRDTILPELQKSQTTLNVERNEGHLAQVEAELSQRSQLEADVNAGIFVSRYENEVRRSARAGFLSEEKAHERIKKFADKVYSDRFERMIAMDPEAAFRAVNSNSYADREMLNHVSPKILESFLKERREGMAKASKDDAEKIQAYRESIIDPLVRTGGISRADVIALRPEVKAETWNRWMSQLDANDKRIQDAIEKRRKGEEANLKIERDELRKQFYDLYFNGQDIPKELHEQLRLKLDDNEYREVEKFMSDRRASGGAGDENLMLRRKEMLKRDPNAFSEAQIAKMTDLNVRQRLELYKARDGEIALLKAAQQDPHHFSKDPAYKFYEKQIEDRLGVIPLSPFTSGHDIQVVARAQTEYRQAFDKAYAKGKKLTEREADQLADEIVGRYRKLLTIETEAVKAPAKYKTPQELDKAWASGKIKSRDEYVAEWEKIKAAQQAEQAAAKDKENKKKWDKKGNP